jgi:lipoyl(octanoyl) transferase
VDVIDLTRDGVVTAYDDAWALQREVHAAVVKGSRSDTIILVEHPSVYTAGRRTAPRERPADGTPVIDVDRGGRITWHGPGQLVGYPIVRLRAPLDVVRYVRVLEEAIIAVCAGFDVPTVRVEGRSGVWCPATPTELERKICAIGVRVAGGVTMHGFALNCDSDLSEFKRIIPCGIDDADVTSLSAELGKDVPTRAVIPATLAALERCLADVRLNSPRPQETM